MACRPSIEIDGVVYRNVVELSYEIRTSIDETGRPSDKSRAGLIKVKRVADEESGIAKWAAGASTAGDTTSFRSGKMTIRYIAGMLEKEISFEKAFVSRYEEKVPYAEKGVNTLPMEYFEISCGKLSFDADNFVLDNRWEEGTSGD